MGGNMDETLPLPVTDTSSPRIRLRIHQFLARIYSNVWINLAAGNPPSSSSEFDEDVANLPLNDVAEAGTVITSEEEGGYVEKVVVEQTWGSGPRSKPTSDGSDPAEPKESKSGEIQPVQMEMHETEIDGHDPTVAFLLRTWLKAKHFFYPMPFDVGSEEVYDRDDWYSKKNLAQVASAWLIVNLILACISVPRPWTLIDYIFYSGIAPVLTLPIFVMVMFSWPRERPVLYQIALTFSLWMWPFILVINIRICSYYVPLFRGALVSCNRKDFINTFFYATAMQAIGLFGLRLERLYAAIAAALWFIVSCALIIPQHQVWWRSMLNFAAFHMFLIWVHERRESSERRLYAMKVQVKIQYKALQRAQANERRTTESKHRLTSYVFHEVRVPLNSALLAAQSMETSGTISKTLEVEFEALMGSLTTMSQVLNDILDFNRLDSGQFELVSKPYPFHQTVRSLIIPLQMATAQKGLTLHTELDPNIDRVARCAAYRAMGETEEVIQRHLEDHPDVDGVVIGDQARFRQIVTNFASNAVKFTSAGGAVTIKTKLVMPSIGETAQNNSGFPLSASRLAQHDYDHTAKDESIIIRVEVIDTGCGIEGSELTGPKLFSAFNQTERGKQQGGKGTGLGLALVRNIVKLSGGRLGVKSQFNKGSTFWVELPLSVGRKALAPSTRLNISRSNTQESASTGANMAKEKNFFVDNVKPAAQLTKLVDVTALNASEISLVALTSNTEPVGHNDLVVDSQTDGVPPTSIPTMTNPAPTVHMELSFSPTNAPSTVQQPAFIRTQLNNTIMQPSPARASPSASSVSSLSVFDNSFSRTNGSAANNDVPAPQTNHDVPNKSPPSYISGLPVLVVDDDSITRTMMDRVLKRQGCDVTTAENGRVALELILGDEWDPGVLELKDDKSRSMDEKEESKTKTLSVSESVADNEVGFPPKSPMGNQLPDISTAISQKSDRTTHADLPKFAVVFLDNSMPVLNGLRTVEILRRLRRRDFIVGLTGNALLPDVEEYIQAGVDIVLTKPVMKDQMTSVLKEANARRQRQLSFLQERTL